MQYFCLPCQKNYFKYNINVNLDINKQCGFSKKATSFNSIIIYSSGLIAALLTHEKKVDFISIKTRFAHVGSDAQFP